MKSLVAMNIVKTDLRNQIGDEWMNDSLVVYIEKEVFRKIEKDVIYVIFKIWRFVGFSCHLLEIRRVKCYVRCYES